MAQKSASMLRGSMSTLRSVSQSSELQPAAAGALQVSMRKGPSFMGILASKRLARQFASRVAARRLQQGRPGASSRSTTVPGAAGAEQEASYRLGPHRRFNSAVVTGIVMDVLQARLPGFIYNARQAALISKVIAEEIKDRVKACHFDRYKIICLVSLGEKKGQGVRVSSRCVWDPSLDAWASHSWENTSAYCTATVYGIYHE